MTADEAQYCADQVRRFDPERWLTILVAPAHAQRDLIALHAFNLEIARVRESVREVQMGSIRLQWWRDALAETRDGAARHPVAGELALTMRRFDLAEAKLLDLIDAREADLDDAPCADLPALLRYAEATSGALAVLAMTALGHRDTQAASAARQVGTAWALLGILRAAPFLASAGRCQLPRDLLAREGISLESWFAGEQPRAAREIVRLVAETARQQLDDAARKPVPRGGFSAVACAVLARIHLRRLQQVDHDVFDPRVQAALPSAALRLALARLLNRR